MRVAARVMAAEASGISPLRRPNAYVATGLSVIPGLGQLYNGHPRKAVYFLLFTLLTIGPAILLITEGQNIGHGLLARHSDGLFLIVALLSVVVFIGLFLTGLFAWASAAIDAWQSAKTLRSGDAEAASRRRMFRL